MKSIQIDDFLKAHGFLLVKNEVSDCFGDYYTVFSNGVIKLRFIKDKSIKTVDVGSALCNNEVWYDLSLVKNMLYCDDQLNIALTFEQYQEFLVANIDRLNSLFNYDSYKTTIEKLKELQNQRTKQMFPWFKPPRD